MNVDDVLKLIDLMNAHGLAEIEVEDKDGRIRLKKEETGPKVQEIIGIPSISSVPPAEGAAAVPAPENGPGVDHICSPLVGTFYRRANPDSEPYVKVGDVVEEDTVVAVIEAMKVMNEIKAEKAGIIKKVLVDDAHPVEYMQPMFEIEAS